MTRHNFEEQVVNALRLAGALEVIKNHAGISKARGGAVVQGVPKGTPDRLALFPWPIWVEIKDLDDSLAPPQVARMVALRAAGFSVIVASVTPDTTERAERLRDAGVRFAVGLDELIIQVRDILGHAPVECYG